MLSVGDTFLARTIHYSTKHLYIIIAFTENPGEVLFVNVTSKKENCDTTCLLKVGDHNFVKHDSMINYADAKVALESKIQEAITKKTFTLDESVSSGLLKRIQEGALNSPAFPRKYLKYIPKKPKLSN